MIRNCNPDARGCILRDDSVCALAEYCTDYDQRAIRTDPWESVKSLASTLRMRMPEVSISSMLLKYHV